MRFTRGRTSVPISLREVVRSDARSRRLDLVHRVLFSVDRHAPRGERQRAWYAFTINETSEQTPWRPILWPFKAVVPSPAWRLLAQGVSELIKSFYAARTGIVLEHKEKIEI